MKTTLLVFALLTSGAFATDIVTQGTLTQMNLELGRMRSDLQSMQAQAAKPVSTYVAGETADQRKARHTQAIADAEAAYRADWQEKNPLLPSFRCPPFAKIYAERAMAESDAQTAANASIQATLVPQRPDPRIAVLQKRIAQIEAQLREAKAKAKQ